MKRVFTHIGFSFALTMLVLNLISPGYALYAIIGLAVILFASLLVKKYRNALAVPLCLGAAVFACVIFSFTYNNVVLPEQSLDKKNAYCEFYITDIPRQNDDNTYSYTIKTKSVKLSGAPQNFTLKLKTKTPIDAECYQMIKGKLRFYKIGSNAYSSQGYWGKNIFLSSRLKNYYVTDINVKSPMKYITNARQGIKSRLSSVSGDEGALSKALLIGDKSDLSYELINDFRFAGASHLMAVSGLHLTVICGFALFITKKLKISDKAAFSLTIVLVVYYSALCGFSKSIVRAGIMMIILLLGNIIGRHSDTLNSLGLSAFIICLNPFAISDMGAMLSILSILALCTVYPKLSLKIRHIRVFKSIKINDFLIGVLASVCAATCIIAYSLCVMFVFFGYVSVIGVLSSVILIPLGSLATVIAIITDFAIRLKIGLPFILICRVLNKTIILIVKLLASLKFSVISFENYFGFAAAAVLIIFALCFIIRKDMLKKAALVSVAILLVSLVSMAALNSNASYVYIASNGATAICSKGNTAVFGVNTDSDYYSIRRFLSSRRETIDCVFTGQNGVYNNLLSESFDCKRIIHSTADVAFNDDFIIRYKTERDKYNLKADINGITVSANNTYSFSDDINIVYDVCKDNSGIIDLSDSDIIYRITKNNYSVRRVSIWQE